MVWEVEDSEVVAVWVEVVAGKFTFAILLCT